MIFGDFEGTFENFKGKFEDFKGKEKRELRILGILKEICRIPGQNLRIFGVFEGNYEDFWGYFDDFKGNFEVFWGF